MRNPLYHMNSLCSGRIYWNLQMLSPNDIYVIKCDAG